MRSIRFDNRRENIFRTSLSFPNKLAVSQSEMKMTIANTMRTDKRLDERRPYSGDIFFVSEDGFNEGKLNNYSKSGLFIITKAHLSIGEIITIAIPYADGKQIKRKGQVMRRDRDGFGIDLFRDRSDLNLRLIG